MKQIIKLADDTRVEIDGTNVKHINADGRVWYDSAHRIAYDEEQLEHIRRRINGSPKAKSMVDAIKPYLEENIDG